jgi:hypothetical protein
MVAVWPFPTDGFASCVQAIERTAQLAHSQTDLSLLVYRLLPSCSCQAYPQLHWSQ